MSRFSRWSRAAEGGWVATSRCSRGSRDAKSVGSHACINFYCNDLCVWLKEEFPCCLWEACVGVETAWEEVGARKGLLRTLLRRVCNFPITTRLAEKREVTLRRWRRMCVAKHLWWCWWWWYWFIEDKWLWYYKMTIIKRIHFEGPLLVILILIIICCVAIAELVHEVH